MRVFSIPKARLFAVCGLRLNRVNGLFNLHVAKFFRIKDFTTLQAFDEFSVVMPGNDTHARVFADYCHLLRVGRVRVAKRPSIKNFHQPGCTSSGSRSRI